MRSISLMFLLWLVAGCTATPTEFAQMQHDLRHDPAFRHELLQQCLRSAEASRGSMADQIHLSKLLNTSVAAAPRVYCQRFVAANASGRLTYADYRATMDKGRNSANMRKVLQGL